MCYIILTIGFSVCFAKPETPLLSTQRGEAKFGLRLSDLVIKRIKLFRFLFGVQIDN